ncbi:MAG: TldD/PmbA family protein [Clostridia bacterium]|nr:TldD/PmbA family protein [Clostridia bacterium]
MKLKDSEYLSAQAALLTRLSDELSAAYPYASVLAQDSVGMRMSVSKRGISVSEDSVNTKRGFVVRVHNGKALAEYSFNDLNEETLPVILKNINACALSAAGSDPVPEDKPLINEYSSEYQIDPEELGTKAVISKLDELRENSLKLDERLADCIFSFSWQKIHKAFISKNRRLRQNVLWTNAAIVMLTSDGKDMKDYYRPFSGLCGAELLDSIKDSDLEDCARVSCELLSSEMITPSEYECVCDPDVTGMIVHEAFGHGVEMDMFVKDRALAKSYVGKQVASELVTMHDGAAAAEQCASYLFDDEGTQAQDSIVIKNGILISGYADSVSAARLGVKPTGNGRRESFERKAYTRMTNTFFEGGNSTPEEMIKSVKYGFLLENPSSGMEDPKNWGIQCMVNIAREIKDGELTGRIFSPIVLTGYVPDLLKSISMLSRDVVLSGSGYCGKGYKEWVKVSDGGPYIKAHIRLG